MRSLLAKLLYAVSISMDSIKEVAMHFIVCPIWLICACAADGQVLERIRASINELSDMHFVVKCMSKSKMKQQMRQSESVQECWSFKGTVRLKTTGMDRTTDLILKDGQRWSFEMSSTPSHQPRKGMGMIGKQEGRPPIHGGFSIFLLGEISNNLDRLKRYAVSMNDREPLIVLKQSSTFSNKSRYETISEHDPNCNFLMRRSSSKLFDHNGVIVSQSTSEVVKFKEIAPGVFFPAMVNVSASTANASSSEYVYELIDAQFLNDCPSEILDFRFPPGCMVEDYIQLKVFRADEHGQPTLTARDEHGREMQIDTTSMPVAMSSQALDPMDEDDLPWTWSQLFLQFGVPFSLGLITLALLIKAWQRFRAG